MISASNGSCHRAHRRVGAWAAAMFMLPACAGITLAQPGVRGADEPPAMDAPATNRGAPSANEEPALTVAVLRANGEVLIATWISLDSQSLRALDSATNQIVTIPINDVLGLFAAASGARASMGIGGIASPMLRPLVPGPRVIARTTAGDASMIRAVDGMTLPGAIKPSAGNADETVRWEDPILGSWSIELDRVAWIWRERIATEWLGFTAPNAVAPGEDIVALANGDRVSGFVVEIGSTLEMEREDGTALSLPIDRVAGVWLANPPQRRSGIWAFTDLGIAIPMGQVIGSSDEHLTGSRTDEHGEPIRIAHAELVALLLAAERVLPLSSITPESVVSLASSAGEPAAGHLVQRVRHPLEVGLPIGPAFGADDLLLTRAMEARWPLPESTQRFVATARLPDPRNPWSAATLVVEIDGREPRRFTLTPDQPVAAINLDAAGRSLTIRVEPGRFGPVQNAVLLHRPLLIQAGE